MKQIDAMLLLVERYCAATGMAEATLSSRVFFDGKRIAGIRHGSDIGVRRLTRALHWFADNWPDETPWPEAVERPIAEAAE